MKKLLITLVFAFFCLTGYSQSGSSNKLFEKLSEKYSVQTVTVLGRIFNVGDTLTLLSGSNNNGDFISVKLSAIPGMPGETLGPVIPANFMGRKFIILKIFSNSDGLNIYNTLVCDLGNKVHIYIDPLVGLTRKEIK